MPSAPTSYLCSPTLTQHPHQDSDSCSSQQLPALFSQSRAYAICVLYARSGSKAVGFCGKLSSLATCSLGSVKVLQSSMPCTLACVSMLACVEGQLQGCLSACRCSFEVRRQGSAVSKAPCLCYKVGPSASRSRGAP